MSPCDLCECGKTRGEHGVATATADHYFRAATPTSPATLRERPAADALVNAYCAAVTRVFGGTFEQRMTAELEARAALVAKIEELVRDANAYAEVLDAACTGLRDPMTLDDAYRVRAMLTHHHVELKKRRVRAARSSALPETTDDAE